MADGQLYLPDAMFGTRRCANRGLMELGCEAELRTLCGLAADGVRARSRSPRRGRADGGAIVPLRLPDLDMAATNVYTKMLQAFSIPADVDAMVSSSELVQKISPQYIHW